MPFETWDKAKAPPALSAQTLSSYLGILRARQGGEQDAQRVYERALDMREKLHGRAGPELLFRITNLASSSGRSG